VTVNPDRFPTIGTIKTIDNDLGLSIFSLDTNADRRDTRTLRTRGFLQSRAGFLTAPAPHSRTQNEGHEAVDRTPTPVRRR
jgi:hypothetical protein